MVCLFYEKLGRLDKSIESYRASLAINEKIGDMSEAAKANNNLGSLHSSLGKYDVAIEYYRKSLQLRKELDNEIDGA